LPNHSTWTAGRLLVAAACLATIGACSSFGSFGEGKSALAPVPDIQFYASDEAVAKAKVHFKQGNYGHAATFYKRAVELAPNDPDALAGLAASYDRLRRFDLADRVYAALYKATGGTVSYYNNVGYSYLLRGDLPSARKNFLKAYDLDPENAVVANNLQLLGASDDTIVR
jgi:Flp pilus assembly protein TadD